MKRIDVVSAAAIAAAFLSSPAFAEEGGDEIIVTASRSGEGIARSDLGGSASLIDANALEARQVREISDVLRDVPGVAVSRIGSLTQVRLRGAEGNHTLILVDGIEVSDPYYGEFDFGTLIADDAARIEVLRGQQSALYGSDAIGGVIHYITATGAEAPGYSVRAEAGSFGTFNAAARAGGVAGTLDYAVTAGINATEGTPDAPGGSRDLPRLNLAASAKLIWSPAANAKVTAVARYARTEADFNNSDYDPASPTYGLTIDSPGSHFDNEAIYGLLRGDLALLDGRWTHALSAQIADTEREGYDLYQPSYGDEGQRKKGSYETSFRFGTETLRHRITAAVDVEREEYRNTDPTGYAFTGKRHTDNVGLVGQYNLTGDRFAIGAAIRHDANDRFDDATTYRAQASYRFGTGTRVRAAAGSGVKNPGFYELYGYVDGRYIGNADLKPEKSEGWEAGIEQSFAGERGLIGFTYFNNVLKDEIYTIGFPAVPRNATEKSKQRGVEAFAQARIGAAWRIDASYTYTHARQEGEEEVRRAPHIASLNVAWRAPEDRGGATLTVRYNGEQKDLAYIDCNSWDPVRVTLDDFVLVNLAADWKLSDALSAYGRIENLLDTDYQEVFGFRTPGRAAYAGLRARF